MPESIALLRLYMYGWCVASFPGSPPYILMQVIGPMTPGMGLGPTPTSMGTRTRESGATT